MRIKSLQLKNFKRFTDLTISGLPETTKLVLLIGSNGCGKSSVFDGFNCFVTGHHGLFPKNNEQPEKHIYFFSNLILSASRVSAHAPTMNAFYGRTSFRQVPRLNRTTLGNSRFDIEKNSDKSDTFIDFDRRFENDLENITGIILKDFFRGQEEKEDILEKFIAPINRAFDNIFGENEATRLTLLEIIPPLEGKVAQINFRKGASEFHYDYLSAGEKEVFNILINLLSRSRFYQDTIYYFDEIDLHLNTALQFNFLKEITENWIPENCQLWTASHSLGFIEYAKQASFAEIIDFDNLDFDLPQILSPIVKSNPEIYDIAVGKEFLPSLFQHFKIYLVENKDQKYYANVGISGVIFVSDANRNSVYHKSNNSTLFGIVDRDFLTEEDIALIYEHYPRLVILGYYSIENYLFHPDNLAEYYAKVGKNFDKPAYIEAIISEKNMVKTAITVKLTSTRLSYPYFDELEPNLKLRDRFKNRSENESEAIKLGEMLESNDFETFYKILPMKDYCTQIPQRQNIDKIALSRTSWFKTQIENTLASRE